MTDLTCLDKTMSMYIAMEGAVMVDLYCAAMRFHL